MESSDSDDKRDALKWDPSDLDDSGSTLTPRQKAMIDAVAQVRIPVAGTGGAAAQRRGRIRVRKDLFQNGQADLKRTRRLRKEAFDLQAALQSALAAGYTTDGLARDSRSGRPGWSVKELARMARKRERVRTRVAGVDGNTVRLGHDKKKKLSKRKKKDDDDEHI